MIPANAGLVEDFDRRSENVCRTARRYLSITILASIFGQMVLNSSLTNLLCTFVAAAASLLTFQYVLNAQVVRKAPLPAFAVLAFNISTMSGALFAQTLSLRTISYNLKVPEFTFITCAIYQIIILVALHIFVSSGFFRRASKSILGTFWRPMGLVDAPAPIQYWVMGIFGTAITAWTATFYTNEVNFGDAASKSLVAFLFFASAPFLLPLAGSLLPGKKARRPGLILVGVGLYLLLVLVAAIARNSRGSLATGITQLALGFVLAVLLGQLTISRKLARQFAIGLFVFLFASSILTDLSTAMLVARGERGSVDAVELIGKTFDAYQDKARLEAYRNLYSFRIGKNDYDEEYVANPFVARFVQMKFFDNTLSYENVVAGNYASEIWDVTVSKTLALMPTPLIQLLGIYVDKNDITYSMGDLLYYLENAGGMGGFKVGSPIGHGMGLMGSWFFITIIPTSLLLFVALQSLTAYDSGRIILAPVLVMQLMDVFYTMCGDSLLTGIYFAFRNLPQSMVIYLFVLHSTRILFGLFGKKKWKKPRVGQKQLEPAIPRLLARQHPRSAAETSRSNPAT